MNETLTLDGHVLRLSDEILMQCATSEPIEPEQPSRASSSGTGERHPGVTRRKPCTSTPTACPTRERLGSREGLVENQPRFLRRNS